MSSIIPLLIASSIGVATSPSYAASRDDGLWSVSVVTDRGDCAPSHRYPMLVTNGVGGNVGSADIVAHGSVAPSGAVSVVVSLSNSSAIGYGRLSGPTGRGSWRGAFCSGSWTAERHN